MNRKQKKMLARIILAAVIMVSLFFVSVKGIVRFVLYMVPYFVLGYDILWRAIKGILNRQIFDENFLMAIATVGAIIIAVSGDGDYTEAIAVMLFYQIGELFQSYAVGKSRRNISKLMDIRPDYANVEVEGEWAQVDPEEVPIGTVILIRPGEKVPIDGVIREGNSVLNTSALTGESLPKDVRVGEEILSGCINMTGVIKVQTTKEFGESTVSKILDLVENASSRKSRSEAFISKFAKVYTPAVCYSALALALLPPIVQMLFLNATPTWGEWIYRALTFLVISCPCALVISIPLTFFAGLGGAGNAGILVKGSNYLEALSKVDIVVFDKTGTLTKGQFEVTYVCCKGMEEQEFLECVALAESASSHPISESLRLACEGEMERERVREIQEISGEGVTALVDGRKVTAGNDKLMRRLGISYEDIKMAGTVVYVSIEEEYAGYIVVEDVLKENATLAIEQLKKNGIQKTVMLTGDRKEVAEQVAVTLQIDETCSELLPGDKVEQVEAFLPQCGKGKKLVFVGDGINDAPVLSRADVGIAMGAMGSDAAIEAADVVLMDDDPRKVATAIRISRKCMSIVYQNIGFALGVKGICLILGALGIANMWLAIFADVGVMVLAVLNAIRALFVRGRISA